ncbi:hypothetical protein O1611_g8940 [Lasiodiplodia mahajangana]|uniref:Uncharacterized protein n=1 Tax=Lasiodiplodia mahajangana TaxID=1108764 RepID=A0ACC2JB39_9PEZI|nr:hypothetical protein O1611_g8940 [Lasiodiplodia mahajangana]
MEIITAWLGGAIPSALWTVVRWVTFFFKLASLAFAVPIIGLIVFDFCVWLWRLFRPSLPADSPRPSRSNRLPKDYVQQPAPSSARAFSTVVELKTESQAIEKRTTYETTNG